jgi:microcystin-dependent protein
MTIIDRRHSVSEGIAIKAPCRAATTANVVLAGEQAADGIALVAGDRVLVKHQTDGRQNGIYEVSTGNWTRTRDFDGAFDIVKGTVVRVTNGSTNVGYWEVTTANPIAIDTTSIAFALTTNSISGVSAYVSSLLGTLSATALFQSFIDAIGVRSLLNMLFLDPVGRISMYGGSAAPTGYLLCNGQAVSRTTYAGLFAVIGTTFGAGDGSTTFLVPDMGGRVPAGKESSATRLTSGSSGVDGATLGATGGAQTHTLTTAQMPIHSHTFTGTALPAHGHALTATAIGGGPGYEEGPNGASRGGASLDAASAGTPAGTNSSTGGGGAHPNVQPTIILNFIIKT